MRKVHYSLETFDEPELIEYKLADCVTRIAVALDDPGA